MMSPNGNIFRVTGPLCGEFTGHRALMFSLICAWINGSENNREAGDLRCQRPHYDITVMIPVSIKMPQFMNIRVYVYTNLHIRTNIYATELLCICKLCVFIVNLYNSVSSMTTVPINISEDPSTLFERTTVCNILFHSCMKDESFKCSYNIRYPFVSRRGGVFLCIKTTFPIWIRYFILPIQYTERWAAYWEVTVSNLLDWQAHRHCWNAPFG